MSVIPVPKGRSGLDTTFGKFKFTVLSRGQIDVDDTWEADNIVTLRNVCGTGRNIQLHRLIAPIFEACLRNALAAAPGYKVRLLGGYAPRFQRHDPKLPLSVHSWGAAFDINWDKNPMKPPPVVTDLPTAFVAEFTKAGWSWGGHWTRMTDSMHFQWATGI